MKDKTEERKYGTAGTGGSNSKPRGNEPALKAASLFMALCMFSGCSSFSGSKKDLGPTRVKKEGYNFTTVQKISVLDFVDYKDEPNSGKIVASAFMKKLISQDFTVIDGSQLQTIMDAKQLSKIEDLDTDVFSKIKERINIDLFLTGTVIKYKTENLDIPPELLKKKKGKYQIPTTRSTVGLNVRFVDVKDGSIVWMDSIEEESPELSDALNDAVDKIIDLFLDDRL